MDTISLEAMQNQVNHLSAEVQDLLESEQPSLYQEKIAELMVSLAVFLV
jgi:hypothetical protein